ncbi:MAG: GTP 3',8-cyclase MoaA [Actinomycetota bacterium]
MKDKKMAKLIDSYSRNIDYLRVSVTDRCNLRCTYCMPGEGIKLLQRSQLLTLEEIIRVVDILSHMGIRKVRLTGGEPLLRENILTLIKGIKATGRIEDISITTNGILLKKFLKSFYRLGIRRLNISIDSLDKKKYSQITRGGNLDLVLEALEDSIEMGFGPIKINTVLTSRFDLDDARRFIDMANHKPVSIRFIEMMQIPGTDTVECTRSTTKTPEPKISTRDIFTYMNQQSSYSLIKESMGFGPAVYYRRPESRGSIGFIENSRESCSSCNRIRLTSRGALKLCLFSGRELDIKKELKKGSPEEIKEMIAGFIKTKPRDRNCSSLNNLKIAESMNRIGG